MNASIFDVEGMGKGRVAETRPPKGDDFLSLAELKALTPQMVVERCKALTQPLRDHAFQAEIQRRPIDHLWEQLRRSGYFNMLIPNKFGGLEADIDSVCEATMAIASGCGSTGWVASFGMMHNRHLIEFPVEFQEEVLGGGKFTIWAGGTMPPGKAVKVSGGYRVSGRMNWGTCSTQADWFNATCVMETEKGPQMLRAMVPAKDVTVLDTWFADGMRATGTNDWVVDDVFVPEHRASTGALSREGYGQGAMLYPHNPIYRVPLSPLLTFCTLMVVVGVAKSAVEIYHQRLAGHTKRGTDAKQSEKQASQIRLAKADTMIATADQLMRSAIKENLKGTDLRGDAQIPFRSRLRAQMCLSATLCREAVIMICESTGTSIHYLDNPLQRILRDTMVGTSHIVFDHDVTFEQHGRGMLGLPPNSVVV
jgi:alkylation response protein AidB-like acyl-CoA dehydrogenase